MIKLLSTVESWGFGGILKKSLQSIAKHSLLLGLSIFPALIKISSLSCSIGCCSVAATLFPWWLLVDGAIWTMKNRCRTCRR